MWDERFNTVEYAYGKKPNDFLKNYYKALPMGCILSLAEGEGRNAVFLAMQGYNVTAVDSSSVGLKKAEKLASECGVEVELIHADLMSLDIEPQKWDGIVSIFFPLVAEHRKTLHNRVVHGLKREGVYLLEAYRPEQLHYGTGGGSDVDQMQSSATLEKELIGMNFKHNVEIERNVVEGNYHTGAAAVVQAIAVKP